MKAEASNPKGDVWFGGTGDPHLQAAEEGLSEMYQSPNMKDLHNWAQYQADIRLQDGRHLRRRAGFQLQHRSARQEKLPPPACWADIIKPEYKGDVQMANPAASGHRLHGAGDAGAGVRRRQGLRLPEGAAQEYFELSEVGHRTGEGRCTRRNGHRRELHARRAGEKKNGFPVEMAAPARHRLRGRSMSILKGARNLENAKKFYDWALTPDAQKLAAQAKSSTSCRPTKRAAAAEAPRFSSIKADPVRLQKYGSSAERKRLLESGRKRSTRFRADLPASSFTQLKSRHWIWAKDQKRLKST